MKAPPLPLSYRKSNKASTDDLTGAFYQDTYCGR
jgi:hypothetical protein